jgi:hypothetical protein
VPVTSFSEYNDTANPKSSKSADGSPHPMAGKKDVVWFALSHDRPLFAFAGIWTIYPGERGTKSNPVSGPHGAFGFLTTEPNVIVAPVHAEAMPVILTTPASAITVSVSVATAFLVALDITCSSRLSTHWTSAAARRSCSRHGANKLSTERADGSGQSRT